MGCVASICGLEASCVIFNEPDRFGNHVGVTRPSVSTTRALRLGGVKLRPCCGAARGVGQTKLGSHSLRRFATALFRGLRSRVPRALPS